MPRKFFRKYLPSHESVRANKYLQRFGSFLHHPNLWHLNRNSVAGGVAIGLFAGLIPGPFQMLTAALLAVPLRVNLPVALATTLYTNPLTIVPLYLIAYQLGQWATGASGQMIAPPDFAWARLGASIGALVDWMSALGRPLAVGLLILAVALALVGWIAVRLAWRGYVVSRWRSRQRARRQCG